MNIALTGAEYVSALEANAADRRSRLAFQTLALSLVKPGAMVFDFGCGPGIDARRYAERSLRVVAYDVDATMCDYFRAHCAAWLRNGAVTLTTGSYDHFLEHGLPELTGPVDLITANFAPLNLAARPGELFERFARLLAPGGRLLASVLNPLYAGDWRHGWWWRDAGNLVLRGELAVAGAQGPITRYLPRRLRSLAAPNFRLEAMFEDHAARPGELPRRLRSAVLGAWHSRFLFLLLRRADP
jgi:SAM-dependent methyltransferase